MCCVSLPSPCHLAVSEHLHKIGLIVAFTIPRVPGLTLNQQNGLVTVVGSFNKSIPSGFSRIPANFSFLDYSLEFNTTGNYLPLTARDAAVVSRFVPPAAFSKEIDPNPRPRRPSSVHIPSPSSPQAPPAVLTHLTCGSLSLQFTPTSIAFSLTVKCTK
jgi:hypothetical protein